MNVATNYLREHLPVSYRMHYIILEGGEAPNVVPDKASVWYYVRNTDERLVDMYERVINCAKAAALATGTEMQPIRVISAIHQTHSNKGMAELLQKNSSAAALLAWRWWMALMKLHRGQLRAAGQAPGFRAVDDPLVHVLEAPVA